MGGRERQRNLEHRNKETRQDGGRQSEIEKEKETESHAAEVNEVETMRKKERGEGGEKETE